MNKFVILLVCATSLVAAGVLDNSRLQGGIMLQGIQDDSAVLGGQLLTRLSRGELLQQKFLLDVLQHVQQPLVNVELLELANTLIVDQNRYVGGIDEEMLHVIELCRNQRLLGHHEVFTIINEDHVRQMIGLYRLLVRARDWDTLQRNVCCARMHVNGVLLVNALLLAIRDRADTQNLIIPAMHEILPELYYDEEIVGKVQNMDMNHLVMDTTTMRPGLLDMIGMNRHAQMMHMPQNMNNDGSMNRMSWLDKAQLWMPWRQLRLEMAQRKMMSGSVTRNMMTPQNNAIVLQVAQRQTTLLTEDMGLKALLHGIINELCLKEQTMAQSQRLGHVALQRNMGSIVDDTQRMRMGVAEVRRVQSDNERMMQNRRGMNMDEEGIVNVGMHMMNVNSLPTTDIHDERLLHINRRRLQAGMTNMRQEQGLNLDDERERFMSVVHGGSVHDGRHIERDDDVMSMNGNRMGVRADRMNMGNELLGTRQRLNRDRSLMEGEIEQNRMMNRMNLGRERMNMNSVMNVHSLPTIDINDERLLHINRRRLQANMNTIRQDEGLKMDNERDRFMNVVHGGRVHDGRHIERDDDMDMNGNRMGVKTDRMNMDNVLLGTRQRLNRDRSLMEGEIEQDRMMNRMNLGREGLNMNELPTTNIDDERLLHINRRRLNNNMDESMLQRGQMMSDNNRMGMRRMNLDDDVDLMNGRQRMMMQHGVQDGRKTNKEREERVENVDLKNRKMDSRRGSIDNEMSGRDIGLEQRRKNMAMQRGMEDMGMNSWNRMDQMQQNGRESHMDWMQRRNMNNEPWMNQRRMDIAQHQQLGRMDDVDEIEDWDMPRQRMPRSLNMDMLQGSRGLNMEQVRSGEILMHNLQQLLARINMEQISLGLIDLQDDNTVTSARINNPRLNINAGERLALRLNEMRIDMRRIRLVLEQINELEQRLNMIIEQQVQRLTGMQDISIRNQVDVERVIGEMLMGQVVEGVGILPILREILLQTEDIHGMQTLTLLGVNLRDPIMLHLLRRIVHIIDLQRQHLGSYKREDLLLNGVTINAINVDNLRTNIDITEADLINLLDARMGLNQAHMQRMLIARHQRLNHKDFTINIDVTAERNQRVIVRTLLGPKVDIQQLDQQRHNFMLLDANIVDLHAGQNIIKRHSRDITWTARDVTTLSEIYRRVMLALNGELDMTMARVNGQSCRLPHRLLLPIGRVGGMPMQLLVVITPIIDDIDITQGKLDKNMCIIGMETINMDRLPLGFPLDRRIDNVQEMLNLGNVHMQEVLIHHDNKVVMQHL